MSAFGFETTGTDAGRSPGPTALLKHANLCANADAIGAEHGLSAGERGRAMLPPFGIGVGIGVGVEIIGTMGTTKP